MSDTHDDLPHSEELAADIAEAEAEAGLDDGLGPIDALIAERDQWKDRALRAVAEAENTKKRAETQSNDARAYAIQRFARDLLGVADNLERALQAAPKDADAGEAGLVTGLELTQKSLLQAFESAALAQGTAARDALVAAYRTVTAAAAGVTVACFALSSLRRGTWVDARGGSR